MISLSPEETSEVVSSVKEGEIFTGLTGIVKTLVPGKIEVVRPYKSPNFNREYQPGDIIWVYTNQGEGYFKVWFNRHMYSEDAAFLLHGSSGWIRCAEESTCWGKSLQLPESVWWMKIKKSKGIIGWSNKPESFSNMDACG